MVVVVVAGTVVTVVVTLAETVMVEVVIMVEQQTWPRCWRRWSLVSGQWSVVSGQWWQYQGRLQRTVVTISAESTPMSDGSGRHKARATLHFTVHRIDGHTLNIIHQNIYLFACYHAYLKFTNSA